MECKRCGFVNLPYKWFYLPLSVINRNPGWVTPDMSNAYVGMKCRDCGGITERVHYDN